MDAERRSEPEETLVEFRLKETGDTLYLVLRYDPDDWRPLYVAEDVEAPLEAWQQGTGDAGIADVVEDFRREGEMNRDRERLFEVGDHFCSLHLFEEWAVLHFGQGGRGLVFGYDSDAASHLSSFVDLCYPFITPVLATGRE